MVFVLSLQISLGSSDTLFMWIDKARPQLMGHVFVNPVDENAYMAMLWYDIVFILHCFANIFLILNMELQ
jgi:hypothetical protein